jgi:hypothetical protein
MTGTPRRQSIAIAIFFIVILASLALAVPAAASVRQTIGPQLPVVVIVLGTLAGVWQLVTGIVVAVGNGGVSSSAAIPLALGVSALLTALAFLPPAPHAAPRLLPVVGAALFAIVAAMLQRRARVRAGS